MGIDRNGRDVRSPVPTVARVESVVPDPPSSPPVMRASQTTGPVETPASSTSSPPIQAPTIPEVATLHDQFTALNAERVARPYDSEVAKLNAGYIGALDRAISEAASKGKSDDVKALEAEKERLYGKKEVPADDPSAPETLRKLKTIYRESLTKLELQKAENIQALINPLVARLDCN